MKLPLHLPQVKKHWKLILQLSIGILSIALAVYFIKHERTELTQVKSVLSKAKPYWLISGVLLIFLFVAVQGWMYQQSFKAVRRKIPFKVGLLLFLKRNFVSIFIPAGTLTNVLFFNKDIEHKQGIEKTYIYYASTLFSICSILSSILVAIPALLLLFIKGDLKGTMVYGTLGAIFIFGLLVFVTVSVVKKGIVYHFIAKKSPAFAKVITELQQLSLHKGHLLKVLLWSCVIELIGIAHLYIAMGALKLDPSIIVAVIGYALVLLILMSSPFLRGIGAIELALTYALTLFNYNSVAALSVVFLFRFFEFWSVMILGLFAILFKKDGLFMQLLAPVLLFFLGIANVLSSLTPALVSRMKILKDFIPYDVIEVSTTAVLIIGIILIITAVALLRGYKNSYYLALFLTIGSLVGHLFKGIDYEESMLAGVTTIVLLYQRETYYIKSLPLQNLKWQNGILLIGSVLAYGIIGFYALDTRHFNTDFSLEQSVIETLKSFVLMDNSLNPVTSFGRYFLYSINMLGIASILYFIWLLYRQKKIKHSTNYLEVDKAKRMVEDFGNSSMDYFKTYEDKQLYFFENDLGFISYKTTKRYAVVLENPVLKDFSSESVSTKLKEFELVMLSRNLNAIYYRIPESTIGIYDALGKKKLLLGEDAYVNLETFTTEGSSAKPLRNAVNKIKKEGYVFKINEAPQSDGFLQQLEHVSNAWLKDMDRTELSFSQGYFNIQELKTQTILTVENDEGRIIAFVNLIPNNVPFELNFDLIRKTKDAPNGTMDFLFTEMMRHYKTQGFKTVCLGMVPLSGIDAPENVAEQALKVAYERIKQFDHYKSLRFFKEKFHPHWIKVYAAYDTDLDLINLTSVLNNVMKHTFSNSSKK